MDGITAFWMLGLNKVVCDCVLWRSGSHWYAGNWKSCNVCRIFSVKAIFETRESRPKLISSTQEQNFQKCPALNCILLILLRGYCTSYPKKAPKLTCFVLYLKIINIFLKNNIYAFYSKLSKEFKNNIKIKVGQTVLELLIQKQHFDCFDL